MLSHLLVIAVREVSHLNLSSVLLEQVMRGEIMFDKADYTCMICFTNTNVENFLEAIL